MPAAQPPEFRRRAAVPARKGTPPVAQIAKDLGDQRVVPAELDGRAHQRSRGS
jgi:hypothetical protein